MDYEEYMRSVLGYSQIPNNIYTNTYDDFYYDTQYQNTFNNTSNEVIESMYPDIYRIVYPMVSKVCMQNCNREITRDLIERMTDEIYSNIEPDDKITVNNNTRTVLKNGDVRNPNAKEPEVRSETRQSNFMLRDLIRILILRELLRQNRPGGPGQPRPPMPPPRPPMRPPMNQRPPWRPY